MARVYDYLRLKGVNPFYVMTGIEAGRFDEQLKMRLIQVAQRYGEDSSQYIEAKKLAKQLGL